MIIHLTEPQLAQIEYDFQRMRHQNLNHNPKCPYSFTVPDSVVPGLCISQVVNQPGGAEKLFKLLTE